MFVSVCVYVCECVCLLCCYIYSNQVSSPHHLQLVLQLVQIATMLSVSASHTHTHTHSHTNPLTHLPPSPLLSQLRHVELLSYRPVSRPS